MCSSHLHEGPVNYQLTRVTSVRLSLLRVFFVVAQQQNKKILLFQYGTPFTELAL
jgi:hypothetical protein